MNPYLYILIKYFVVILLLVLVFKYTNLFSILPPIIFLIILSIIFDVMFYNATSTDAKTVTKNSEKNINIDEERTEHFSKEAYVKPSPAMNVYRKAINNDLIEKIQRPEKLREVQNTESENEVQHVSQIGAYSLNKPKSSNTLILHHDHPNKGGLNDGTLFNNYKSGYYEEGIENGQNSLSKSKYVNDQLSAYDIYLKNSYKASLE